MVKRSILSNEDIKYIILQSLYESELISDEVYEKCKPHIQSLPYDNRTNDENKLKERKDEIDSRISKLNDDLDKLNKDTEDEINKLGDESYKFINDSLNDIDMHLTYVNDLFDELDSDDYEFKQDYIDNAITISKSLKKKIDNFNKSDFLKSISLDDVVKDIDNISSDNGGKATHFMNEFELLNNDIRDICDNLTRITSRPGISSFLVFRNNFTNKFQEIEDRYYGIAKDYNVDRKDINVKIDDYMGELDKI